MAWQTRPPAVPVATHEARRFKDLRQVVQGDRERDRRSQDPVGDDPRKLIDTGPGNGPSRCHPDPEKRPKGYNSLMKTATISETKNQLSALLDRVRHGESILITDRSQPVARLEPVVSSEDAGPDEGRLIRLERAGVIRRARHSRLEEILRNLPPAPKPGGDIVTAVLDERRSGR